MLTDEAMRTLLIRLLRPIKKQHNRKAQWFSHCKGTCQLEHDGDTKSVIRCSWSRTARIVMRVNQ